MERTEAEKEQGKLSGDETLKVRKGFDMRIEGVNESFETR